jgi:hypothetical protein
MGQSHGQKTKGEEKVRAIEGVAENQKSESTGGHSGSGQNFLVNPTSIISLQAPGRRGRVVLTLNHA